jgi:hypothetical protein
MGSQTIEYALRGDDEKPRHDLQIGVCINEEVSCFGATVVLQRHD